MGHASLHRLQRDDLNAGLHDAVILVEEVCNMPTLSHARIRKAVPLAALVLVLAAGAIGLTAIRRDRERELQTNLYTLRTVIDNYTYDQGKEPSSYQDLVDKGYLRKIPAGAPAVPPGGVRQE
jgi:hypothetical protein